MITLKHPVSAFLDYLASPYIAQGDQPDGDPRARQGERHGQAWLGKHDAGTGAYTITHFVYGQEYDLASWDRWWGPRRRTTRRCSSCSCRTPARRS